MEKERIPCPYCGGKMRFWNEGTAGCFICTVCSSQSPLVLYDDPYKYLANKEKTIERALQRVHGNAELSTS